jgi:hypothetical protein
MATASRRLYRARDRTNSPALSRSPSDGRGFRGLGMNGTPGCSIAGGRLGRTRRGSVRAREVAGSNENLLVRNCIAVFLLVLFWKIPRLRRLSGTRRWVPRGKNDEKRAWANYQSPIGGQQAQIEKPYGQPDDGPSPPWDGGAGSVAGRAHAEVFRAVAAGRCVIARRRLPPAASSVAGCAHAVPPRAVAAGPRAVVPHHPPGRQARAGLPAAGETSSTTTSAPSRPRWVWPYPATGWPSVPRSWSSRRTDIATPGESWTKPSP